MANLTITNVDIADVVLKDAEYRDDTLSFPGADTYLDGTILARKEVSDTVTVTPDGGNTGDGTVAAAVAAGSVVPLVGSYNLECIEAVTNGGIFKLEDPNGTIVGPYIETTGVAQDVAGLTLTITDGAADFIVGDKFALVVAADGKLVVYAVAGTGGAQVPKAVLVGELTATGASDVAMRALVSGVVRKERLVIDGSLAGVGITDAVIAKLQDVSIIALDVQELNRLDNQ